MKHQNTHYIQYIPFKNWETLSSIIQYLQIEWQLLEKISCNYSDRIFVPEGTICYQWPNWINTNGDLNGQTMIYIFNPNKSFYYIYSSIWGNSQCEGYWFWYIEFFVENIGILDNAKFIIN
jgi:hypothetical protein